MFEGRVQLLEHGELAGAALYNALARAVMYCGTTSPFLHVSVNATGGMMLDLDPVGLRLALGSDMPFSASIDGDRLNVLGGIVWLCDRKLEVEKGWTDLDGSFKIWVEIRKNQAKLVKDKDFPAAVDVGELLCNWPVAEVEENKDKTFTVVQRHHGDIVIMTMPHIFLPGFDAGKTLFRMCRNGNERYIEAGECEDD